MKISIRYKIIAIFLLVNIIFVGILKLTIYENDLENKIIAQKQQDSERVHIMLVKYGLHLFEYHHNILKGKYIDPQNYLAMVRDLSSYVKNSKFKSIKYYVKLNDSFLLTATSATKKQFKAKSYNNYKDKALVDFNLLSKVSKSKNFDKVKLDNKWAILIEDKDVKYIVVATLKDEYILEDSQLLNISFISNIIVIFSIFTILLILFILNRIIKSIDNIDMSLDTFFAYVQGKISPLDIKYIDKISKDELGVLSTKINIEMKNSIIKLEDDKSNLELDNELIKEITDVISNSKDGIFDIEIKSTAHNPKLNILKDEINTLMSKMNFTLGELNRQIEDYLKKNYTTIIENNYKENVSNLISNSNLLGSEYSAHTLERIHYLMDIIKNIEIIESYLEHNVYLLEDTLHDMKKVLSLTSNDFKFSFQFENSLKVIKQENKYVNNLLDQFSTKYEDSILLIDELNRGVFDNDIKGLLKRFNEVVQDSSVRDEDVQKELISKIKDIVEIDGVSKEKITNLLHLLSEELTKDIRYSLFLIEDKVSKLSGDSSSRVSSLGEIKDISDNLKEKFNDEVNKSSKIQKAILKLLNITNDKKYEIIEEYDFIGKDKGGF